MSAIRLELISKFQPFFHDTLENLIPEGKPKKDLCLDDKVTGQNLIFVKYRGFWAC